MTPHGFSREDSIYRSRDVLGTAYQPETIRGREEAIAEFELCLQPVIDGDTPQNVFLYGKSGVGKTATTRYITEVLKRDAAEYDDLSLIVPEVNCKNNDTSHKAATTLLNVLRERRDEEPISQKAYPTATVFDMLWEDLERVGGTALIILDEIDGLGNDDTLLYQIARAGENRNIEEVKLGIIGISNSLNYRDRLDPSVKDSLCEREIYFAPYDAEELREILEARAEKAFRDGVLEDGTVRLCAALAAQDTGSARQALDLLREAGNLAHIEGAATVTKEHARRSESRLERARAERSMAELTPHARYVLSTLVKLRVYEPERLPARREMLHDEYCELVSGGNRTPLKIRRFHDHLSQLDLLGIVNRHRESTGERGGSHHRYDLEVPLSAALDALSTEQGRIDHEQWRTDARNRGLL